MTKLQNWIGFTVVSFLIEVAVAVVIVASFSWIVDMWVE